MIVYQSMYTCLYELIKVVKTKQNKIKISVIFNKPQSSTYDWL